MGGVLWAVYCRRCTVGGVLWAVYCGRCTVGGVLWAVHCGGAKHERDTLRRSSYYYMQSFIQSPPGVSYPARVSPTEFPIV